MAEFRKRVAIIAAVILMLQTAFGILAGLGTTESLAAGDNSSRQYMCRFTVKVLESPEQWTHADYVIMGQGNNGRNTELDVIKEEVGSDFKNKISKTYKDEESAGWFDSGNIECKDCFPSVIRLNTIFGTKNNGLKFEVYPRHADHVPQPQEKGHHRG